MGSIFIEAKPIKDFAGNLFDHSYLVYRDDSGKESVINGGRESTSTLINPGKIVLQIDIPLSQSEDARIDQNGKVLTPADRYSRELDLGGRNAADVWDKMRSHAQNIKSANLPYIIGDPINLLKENQNSNSVVASVLNSVCINPFFNLPIGHGTSTLPGITNFLKSVSINAEACSVSLPPTIPSTLPTMLEMTNMYLYGQKTTPANKVDGKLIRPKNATSKIDIDTNDFMVNGAGRFAVAADSMVVRRFIEADSSQFPVNTPQKPFYSKEEILKLSGLDDKTGAYSMVHVPSNRQDAKDDYAQREYIHYAQAFKIADGAKFVVEASGERYLNDVAA